MKKAIYTFVLLLLSNIVHAQDYQIRIAFLGNSITIGSGLSNPKKDCYPSQTDSLLQKVFGDTCIVKNFAVSGRTMLKKGDYPLWNETDFEKAWTFAPDICFILLGTNDTKPQNWDYYGDEFFDDYKSMIDTFLVRNPNTKFMVGYPPPAYEITWGINDSVLVNGVIPAVDSILKVTDAELVDFYTPLVDSVHLFPDNIHPNAAGAKVMAKILYDRMIETDIVHEVDSYLPFITYYDLYPDEIRIKDSAEIRFSTCKADTVFLNGEVVDKYDTILVSPTDSTIYTLIAKNENGADTFALELGVYKPIINKIKISPTRANLDLGEELELTISHYDQRSKPILDTTVPITWEIIEGGGHLKNETDLSANFVADEAGQTKIKASYGDISFTSVFNVNPSTTVGETEERKLEAIIFPNPCSDYFNLDIYSELTGDLEINVYDMKGALKINETMNIENPGQFSLKINIANLEPGLYLYKLNLADSFINGKIEKIAE